MAPSFQPHNHGGGKGGGWQVSVPSWNGQSDTFAQYEEVTLLNYVTAQSGQRRVLRGQLIQNLPDKSQRQLFAMRLSRVDPEVVAARIKRKKGKEKRRLEAEKSKEKEGKETSPKDSAQSAPAATAEDDEEDEAVESESDDEELDEEMLRPLPPFEVCKHWRNTVTAPKHVPCSVMGEWGCLYLLHELKKNLATQD